MKVVRGLSSLHETFSYPVVTLGNFDGVHLGHQAILRTVVDRAREARGTAVVFTFEPHPLKVLAPERSPRLLCTFETKVRLFEAAGIDVVIAAEFTRSFAEQHPEDFVRDALHGTVGAREVYVGYNYAFGKGRKGGIKFLKEMGRKYGFVVGVVDAVRIGDRVVSSSLVRDLVSAGYVAEAARYLGRHYSIGGVVVHGDHRGHALGFPTANVLTENELLPAFGVYAVRAVVEGSTFPGVASIGVRPTFGGGPISVEVYLFDFAGDLYGKALEVLFVERLRGEQRFPDAESLVRQMHLDAENARHALAAEHSL